MIEQKISHGNFQISYSHIRETFDFLQNWEERYHFITELGTKIPTYPPEFRIDQYLVRECMSTVFIRAIREGNGRYLFQGDCDTSTVKGVMAILLAMFDGKTAPEIERFDADTGFEDLGLFEHLSPTRHVGVYAMVRQVKRQVNDLEKFHSTPI